MRRPWTRPLLAALGLALAAWGTNAHAQVGGDGVGDEIELRVARFGPGGVCRQGEWVGVLVEVADKGLEQRDLILRIEGEDPDGDRPVFDRAVTSNPGSAQSFWLYTRLGWAFDQGTPITISAWPKSGEDRAREGALAFEAGGRPLARLEATTSGVLDKAQGMIGVLGTTPFGLRGYDQSHRGTIGDNLITGHELTRIVGLGLADLPDRPQGLMQFDALVWGGARAPDPLRLTPEQMRALMGWIEWGGQLVIVLPSIGQEWFARSNPLFELLPDALPGEQIGGVDLDGYRYLLTKSQSLRLPTEATVRFLDPNPGAAPGDAARIMASPDGRTIAVSRVHGAGAVTLIGLDLADPKLVAMDLPEADQFWNRVLGRRVDLDENTRTWKNAQGSNRTPLSFDSDIPGEIAKSGRAYVGVLLGIVVFALYWVLAGPGGYALLGRLKQKRHAWIAFVGAVGVFTAIAWTGATAIRPRRVEVVHLTMLHQVHGQDLQRARTWASVLLPSYGDGAISVRDQEEHAGASWEMELLSPWSPPVGEVFKRASFPDNREYRLDGRRPDTMRMPTRSTVKQVRADWVGEARWKLLAPVKEAGEVGEARLWLDQDTGLVHGLLEHHLPAMLEDVVLIVVWRPRIVSGAMRDVPPYISYAYKLKDWAPGDRRDLYAAVKDTARSQATFEAYSLNLLRAGKPIINDFGRTDSGSALERYYGLELFPMLSPPDFQRGQADDRLARRVETHGMDLGLWFTRPCVIVLGSIENPKGVEAPIPLRVNGRPAPVTGGRTVISWVYPLPDDPAAPKPPDPTDAPVPTTSDD
ncbi:MAG: hypothetical protein R3B57_10265 [Phycisphaerales bacterium]